VEPGFGIGDSGFGKAAGRDESRPYLHSSFPRRRESSSCSAFRFVEKHYQQRPWIPAFAGMTKSWIPAFAGMAKIWILEK
jgi:hypothetical protein